MIVNIHEAKTHLSKLVERAERGEEIVIGRAGKPVAMLVPYRGSNQPRTPGSAKGRIRILPGFDEMDGEIAGWFERGVHESAD
jgi:prevent-host-death family protein